MKYKTKGNGRPNGKRRVYFTCHPEDFSRSFSKITEDILRTHDVAIYYTDPDDPEDNPATDMDLEQMNLFVIPVSFKLLSEPDSLTHKDFVFAQEHKIPVLPIMLESGTNRNDILYSLYKKYFGILEYLLPFSDDPTRVSYEDRLKKYLESVLVDDEMAQHVRDAFDAYVFLSYRKKDRQYANTLMRLIHDNPLCRDIAIWYDEYLVPGEEYSAAIEEAMNKSEMFTLLVTPHLLEMDKNGKPNYVEAHEYPNACKANKDILPVEMEKTDRTELADHYPGISECVIPSSDDEFYDQFLRSVGRIARSENDDDPVHNFLIGLAYLEGIDVEVNRKRGADLITSAAESGLPEAMEKLSNMYIEGYAVDRDIPSGLAWLEKAVNRYKTVLDEDDPKYLALESVYAKLIASFDKRYEDAISILERILNSYERIYGKDDPRTIDMMLALASVYYKNEDVTRAQELRKQAYEVSKNTFGENNQAFIACLRSLISDSDHKDNIELYKQAYEILRNTCGEEHPDSLLILSDLASEYFEYSNSTLCKASAYTFGTAMYQEALDIHERADRIFEQIHDLYKRKSEGDNADILDLLCKLAAKDEWSADCETYIELYRHAIDIYGRMYGDNSTEVLDTRCSLAEKYKQNGDDEEAVEQCKEAYVIADRLWDDNPLSVMEYMHRLALCFRENNDHSKAIELRNKIYEFSKSSFGESSYQTLEYLYILADEYGHSGDEKKKTDLYGDIYEIRKQTLGEEDPDTIDSLNRLARLYRENNDHSNALEMFERLYQIYKEKYGENGPDGYFYTLRTLAEVAKEYSELGDTAKADELFEKSSNRAIRASGGDPEAPQFGQTRIVSGEDFFKNLFNS